jgi:CHASE2 domain-containing sensor protein
MKLILNQLRIADKHTHQVAIHPSLWYSGGSMDLKLIFRRLLIGVTVTLLSTILLLIQFPPFETLESRLLDPRFKIRGVVKPPEKIIIAAIDERSLEKLGAGSGTGQFWPG